MQKKIADSEILVVGVVRNCATVIKQEVSILRNALADFKKVHFFIVESDSSDATLERLNELKHTIPLFSYASLGETREKYPKRTERIAFSRNRYLEEVQNNPAYAGISHVAIADLDGVNTLLNRETVNQSWDLKENWDVITANQRKYYYDIWALRHPDWAPADCHYQYINLKKIMDEPQAYNLAIKAKEIALHKGQPLIEVESAFGGFAMYKREAILASRYDGINAQGNEVCEHVAFHAGLRRQGYKIYINPALINCNTPKTHEPLSKKIRSLIFWPIPFVLRNTGRLLLGKRRFNKYLDKLKC